VTRLPRHSVLVLAGLILAVPASAGTIHGSIRVPATSAAGPAMNAYPGRAGAMAGMAGPERGRVTDAVVYVAKIPAAAESALAAVSRPRPKLAQKDEAFLPRVVPCAAGTTVDFPNMDPIYHNVFSLSPLKRFDLGKYPRGHSKAVTFDRTGLIKVYCDIHSEMEAFVLVLHNHAFAQPRTDGSYELPELPQGHYELHVWHPDLPEIVRTVDVPESGDARVDLNF
jgi:plastocyanin